MKNSENKVHLHGIINEVKSVENESGRKIYFIDLATMESYTDKDKNRQRKYTFHDVQVSTSDKDLIEKLDKIADDCKENIANKKVEGYKPKIHTGSFDGVLTTKKRETEDVTYYNNVVIASEETIRLDTPLQENEVRNRAELKGNIASIDIKDGFAKITIATHYYAPSETPVKDHTGTERNYVEKTNYVDTQISGNFRKDEFEAIKKGEIAVGDLVEARGQIHNNNYTDKDGVNRYKMVVDLNKLTLVAKKEEKKEKAAETKEAPEAKKETKKAASNKKEQAKEEKPKKAVSRKKKGMSV